MAEFTDCRRAINRREKRKIEIAMNFLGPYHDREITLKYLDVKSYDFQTPLEFENSPLGAIGHGDLVVHEISLEGQFIVHQLKFSRGSLFTIRCKDIVHSEGIIDKNH
jgi:hypothetical protein